MTKTEAFVLLDITDTAICVGIERGESLAETVARHFRRAVMQGHPDTGGALSDMSRLLEAKKVALEEPKAANSACVLCRGAGKVRAKMGTVPCVACKGTGDKHGHATK